MNNNHVIEGTTSMMRRLFLVCIIAALPLVASAGEDLERYIVVFKDGIGPNAHATSPSTARWLPT